ncbi:MAG: THUMP domain-containing protein [Marinilabiliaceae bacterium]|nr:THUMP domain-containing protein [Marinilabiliaceae bacterium]
MKLTAKTFHGLEKVLAKELEGVGATNIKILKRAVSFDGNKEVMYRSNLHSRSAVRILEYVTSFDARNEDELYKKVKKLDWSHYMSVDDTFAIDAVVNSRFFKHSKFAALRAKDAVCDYFRDMTGKRPSIDLLRPTILINLHISEDKITISFDSSGETLNRRGYRTHTLEAPINEALAAGMIMISGWTGETNFMDIMCGSGTIVMEAAMIAANIPPNLIRKEFGFMRWRNYDETLWQRIVEEAKNKIIVPKIRIYGSDISMDAIDIARQAALDFGLKQYIDFKLASFKETRPTAKTGTLIINPPYNERLKVNLGKLYVDIGTKIKRSFENWNVWVLSSSFDALELIDPKPAKKHYLLNGPIECGFWNYQTTCSE